jgi:hypothetical protein
MPQVSLPPEAVVVAATYLEVPDRTPCGFLLSRFSGIAFGITSMRFLIVRAYSSTDSFACDARRALTIRNRLATALIAGVIASTWPCLAWSGPSDDSPLSQLLGIARQGPMAFPDTLLARSKDSAQIWGPLFKKQVERCWKKPARGDEPQAQAILQIKLGRGGALKGAPIIASVATTPHAKAFEQSALRAVIACQPYKLPDALFDEWRHFEPVFGEP